jgi:hypothetical protein
MSVTDGGAGDQTEADGVQTGRPARNRLRFKEQLQDRYVDWLLWAKAA